MHTCAHLCVCIWRPEIDVISSSVFTEPGACHLGVGWSASKLEGATGVRPLSSARVTGMYWLFFFLNVDAQT